MSSRTGRHAARSKNGCSTCRIRKVKCDEERPTCSRCLNACIKCEWNLLLPPRRSVANHGVKRRASERPVLLQPATSTIRDGNEASESSSDASTASPISNVSQSLVLRDADVITMPMTISLTSIEMPNSLVLSTQDLKAFHYVPESLMVLRFGKPWRWSMLSYLHSRIAPRDCGVMSAFIAVASMELRFRDLVQYSGSIVTQTGRERAVLLRDSAAKYFHLAIQSLCLLLDQVSRRDPNPEEVTALFAIWFLILHCELYDPDLIRESQIHLNGIRSFITRYLHHNGGMEPLELPPAAQQLLLFITYLDVHLALSNLNGGQLCLDLMSVPRASPLSYDRIWEAARVCLPKLWGDEYPAEEILDDVENYRGLSFLQAGQKLKLSIWQLVVATGKGNDIKESRQRLWKRIEEIGDEFTDLLCLAKAVPNSGGRRVIFTVYHACLDYYAVRVLFTCLEQDETSPWLERTLASLLEIAHKAVDEDSQQLYRISWALAVAKLKVQDRIHRDWIEAQLTKARILLSGAGVPRVLEGPKIHKNVFVENFKTNDFDADGSSVGGE